MKTNEALIRRVALALGNGFVIQHEPTKDNIIGQSGVHTFIDDVITIVLNAQNESDAYKQLHQYITGSEGK